MDHNHAVSSENEDFDLCVNCFDKDVHNHKMEELGHEMEKLGFGLGHDSATCDLKQTNPQEHRLLSLQRCCKYLVHVTQCRGANCRLFNCQKMKRMVQHSKYCKQKTNGECFICKELIAVCCYHAKYCQKAECPVIYCIYIKNKLRQERLQKAQILKRYIVTMQNRGMSGAVLQTSPGNSNSSNQQSPGAQPHSSPHPPKPGIGMKPSTGPPFGAFQAVQQVQTAAARQTASHMVAASVNYCKGNPVVSPPTTNTGLMATTQQMQAQMQKPMSQMMSGVPNLCLTREMSLVGNAQSMLGINHQNPQPNPQLGLRQPTQLMGGPNNMPNSIGNSAMVPPQVMHNPGLSLEGMQRPIQAYEGNMIAPPPQSVWYKQQQHLLAMQRQQQQQPNQFPHLQPPMYPQRPHMPIPMSFGYQQGFQVDSSQFQFQQQPQQILMYPQIKQMQW